MNSKRQAAQDLCLSIISKIVPDGSQVPIYKAMFEKMTDKDFDAFIQRLSNKEERLSIICPNFTKSPPTIENNIELAKKLRHDFFTTLEYEGLNGDPSYVTPKKFMVVDLPMRRASQLIIKKASIPKNQKTVDSLTGQPTGDSKGAKISYPELQLCMAMDLDASMLELMSARGGDIRKRNAYIGFLNKYGSVSQEQLKNYSSGVVSTTTLKTMLTCIHLRNNL